MPRKPKSKPAVRRPRGARPLPPGHARSHALLVRVTPAERAEIARQARHASRSMADYLVVAALGRRFA